MTNKKLNQQQYNILQQMRGEFESLVNHGFTRNLNTGWLRQMKEIYTAIYSAPISISCKMCVSDGMKKLYKKMLEFEQQPIPANPLTALPIDIIPHEEIEAKIEPLMTSQRVNDFNNSTDEKEATNPGSEPDKSDSTTTPGPSSNTTDQSRPGKRVGRKAKEWGINPE